MSASEWEPVPMMTRPVRVPSPRRALVTCRACGAAVTARLPSGTGAELRCGCTALLLTTDGDQVTFRGTLGSVAIWDE